jgi:hypothetical protein
MTLISLIARNWNSWSAYVGAAALCLKRAAPCLTRRDSARSLARESVCRNAASFKSASGTSPLNSSKPFLDRETRTEGFLDYFRIAGHPRPRFGSFAQGRLILSEGGSGRVYAEIVRNIHRIVTFIFVGWGGKTCPRLLHCTSTRI